MELVWVSGRSLSGVSVGLWGGPVQGQCGRLLFRDTVGVSGVPVWGECGSDPLFRGTLCWISVFTWGGPHLG